MNTKKMKKKLTLLIALTGVLALTLTTLTGFAADSYGMEDIPYQNHQLKKFWELWKVWR